MHAVISFTDETVLDGKKDEFLSRGMTKQKMIDLISEKLKVKGCEVNNAPRDAGVPIVKATVRSAVSHPKL